VPCTKGMNGRSAGRTAVECIGVARIKNWGWPKMDKWSEWSI